MKIKQNQYWYRKRIRVICYFLICLIFCCKYKIVKAKMDPINNAKKGMIEVYSGFEDDAGKFHKIKNSSGFVVASSDEKSYVITNYSTVKNSKKKKQEFCNEHKISYMEGNLPDVIQVVLKGDVTVDASILTESELQDYSILEISSSLSEKTPLMLGNSEELVTGETVYTLGFSENAGEDDKGKNRHTEFSALDVEVYEGTIQDIQANQLGILHIQHSGKITKGNTGGPLIDVNGYVVGLNNVSLNKNEESIFYSLPMEEIKTILNNYKVNYGSKDKLQAMEILKKEIAQCQKLVDDKTYKEKSKEELKAALTNANALQSEKIFSQTLMTNTINDLRQTKLLLEPKMKTTRKIIYVLAMVILILTVWLIKLSIEKRLWKEDSNDKVMENFSQHKICNNSEQEIDGKEKANAQQHKLGNLEERTVAIPSDNSNEKKFPKAHLRCLRTGAFQLIDKEKFYIGKKRDLADFVISDNPVISRQHAMIYWNNNSFYINDCNSANGTYVNGKKLFENQSVPLKNGDKIILANEKFIFQL